MDIIEQYGERVKGCKRGSFVVTVNAISSNILSKYAVHYRKHAVGAEDFN